MLDTFLYIKITYSILDALGTGRYLDQAATEPDDTACALSLLHITVALKRQGTFTLPSQSPDPIFLSPLSPLLPLSAWSD